MSDYTTIRLRPEAIGDIRRLTRQAAAAADRNVTQSEAVSAACAIALEHLEELTVRLTEPSDGGTRQ
jgi:uncharacterized protein (DUF1778 family)